MFDHLIRLYSFSISFPFQIESLQMHLIITIHLTRQCKFDMDTLNKIPVSVYHDMNVDALAWSNAVQHNISRWQYICLNNSFYSSKIDFHLLSFVRSFFLWSIHSNAQWCCWTNLQNWNYASIEKHWTIFFYFILILLLLYGCCCPSPSVMYCL